MVEPEGMLRSIKKGVMLSAFALIVTLSNSTCVYAEETESSNEYTVTTMSDVRKLEAEEYAKKVELQNIQHDLSEIKVFTVEEIVPQNLDLTLDLVTIADTQLESDEISQVLDNAIVSITRDEYFQMCKMIYSESGHCSWEMMNGCASAAVNQLYNAQSKEIEKYGEIRTTMTDILNSGRFGKGKYMYTTYENGRRVRKEVTVDILHDELYDAVNQALQGYDSNEVYIGKTIGFWAPNYCSDETNTYFYEHVSGTHQVENVVFFHEWIN